MTSRATADQQDAAPPRVRGAATNEPDDTLPTPERQAELRAAYEANVAAGRPPYANVRLRSRGEVRWILQERGWSGEYDAYTVKYVLTPKGEDARAADLRGVNLSHVPLRDVYLRRADLSGANLVFADLTGAHLADVTLNDADMGRVILHRGELNYATLTGAHLRQADLSSANLQYTNIAGARFHNADLRGTVLHGAYLDARTILSDARLDEHTWLGDISWNGAALTRIDWDRAPRIGDEGKPLAGTSRAVPGGMTGDQVAPLSPGQARTKRYRDAARAYQQLALALQAQGMTEPAARYAYRAQTLQRKALFRQGKLGRWGFSLALALLAGYGYRMGRIILAYLLVVGLAALAYWMLGVSGYGPLLAPHEALLVSVTAFHGRVFAETFQVTSPAAWVAAAEAVSGLLIEGVFIAMLTQRFFSK
ncbi:MAG TPA: pentapeptide repeat-containing protein [Ktedonobacterales bacterium]|jgi:Pentapeptide repeats (8 copies)|nr:pentapeptide repeat-containing protein [Ktedonobacterales bacterium]